MLPLVFEPTRPPVENFVPAGCLLVTVLLLPWVAFLLLMRGAATLLVAAPPAVLSRRRA